MSRQRTFAREERFPSYIVNALGDFLSTLAQGFSVTKLNATTVRVPGGTGNDRAVVAVDGLWRWRDVNTDRAHPGGVAGVYAVFAVAKNNSVTNVPVTDTDNTDYSFDLRIVTDGTTPALVAGTVDVFRKIATLQWDGAQITSVTQLVPVTPRHASTHATGGADPITPASIGAPVAGQITNADVAAGAAIAMSKVALAITNAEVAAGAAIAKAKLAALAIVNADVDPAAAIAMSKVALAITNAEVAAGAAIAESKLALASDAAAGTASRRTLGTGALQAAAGNDSRIVNALDKTLLDVKGDIIVAQANDTPARLGVGANGLFLMADSTAGGGVSWGTPHIADLYANRPAASAALNGLRFFATDKAMEWQCIAAAWVLVAVLAPEGTTMPTAPIDQQEYIYVADATKGTKFHFRYRAASASTSKWEMIGGSDLTAEIDTQETIASVAFANAATIGPDLTVPLAGDWEYVMEADVFNSGAAGQQVSVGLNVGGTGPALTDYTTGYVTASAEWQPLIRSNRKNGLAASTLLRMQYATNPATGAQFAKRRLRLRPIRVT